MKEIFKTWNKFLTEVRAGSVQEVVSLISSGEKVLINVDKPMGTSKTFGEGGEREESLVALGHVKYKSDGETWKKVGKEMPEGIEGNTKIIVSPDGIVTEEDKQAINNFFENLVQFNKVEWY